MPALMSRRQYNIIAKIISRMDPLAREATARHFAKGLYALDPNQFRVGMFFELCGLERIEYDLSEFIAFREEHFPP